MDSLDLQVLSQAREWFGAGLKVWLVTVIETWGSAPRPPGALLCLRGDGLVVGSVSGGCVEDDLIDRVRHGERVDAASLRSDEQLSELLEGAKVRRLSALDHALDRAARGLFICDGCGERILVGRLRALPRAATCIGCAEGKHVGPETSAAP